MLEVDNDILIERQALLKINFDGVDSDEKRVQSEVSYLKSLSKRMHASGLGAEIEIYEYERERTWCSSASLFTCSEYYHNYQPSLARIPREYPIFNTQHQRFNTGTWTHEDVLKLLRKGNPCDAMWNGSFYHSFMFDSLITKVNKKNWTVSVLYVLCSSVDRISLWRDKKSTLEHTLTFKHQQVQ